MVADVLTKGLSKEKHNRFMKGMGLVERKVETEDWYLNNDDETYRVGDC